MELVARGRRRRRVRGIAQPVHDAVRRPLRARHARLPGRRRAGGDAPARRRLRPRGCRGRRPRARRRARGDRRGAERLARSRSTSASAARATSPGDGIAADGRLDPRSVAARIGELLPEDRVVVSDGGHFIGWANMYWPVASPDRMMMVGTAFQSIGLGLPVACPGAALAKPDATIVLTTGDGGGLMALADLESAVRVAGGRGHRRGLERRRLRRRGQPVRPQGPRARSRCSSPRSTSPALAAGVGAEGVVVRTLEDLDRLASWAAEDAASRPFLLLDCRISGTVDRAVPAGDHPRELLRSGAFRLAPLAQRPGGRSGAGEAGLALLLERGEALAVVGGVAQRGLRRVLVGHRMPQASRSSRRRAISRFARQERLGRPGRRRARRARA